MGKADMEHLQARLEAAEEAQRKDKRKQMKKELKAKKDGFFKDFKKFITRGNVLDMAVGVIVGGAFTAIINALSNNILKPIINWLLALIMGKNSLSEIYTFLGDPVYVKDANGVITTEIDLANSIYIDWGAFINAIINFLLIAFTLFVIVRTINNIRKRLDAKELAEAAAKAKAEEDKKKAADAAKAEAEAAAAKAEADRLAAFFANVEKQTKLLEELAKK